MTITAGHCTACAAPIWRTVQHPKTGEIILLYPHPASVYARLSVPGHPDSTAPGIGYCAGCAPQVGEAGPALSAPTEVIALETAVGRYASWYTAQWGAHRRAWLEDHLHLPEAEREALMAQWAEDRRAVEHPHA